jgi:hypothetical protein
MDYDDIDLRYMRVKGLLDKILTQQTLFVYQEYNALSIDT